jgi:hypothetical protein
MSRLTAFAAGAQGKRMQMTEAFASAVAVSVPIFALAAGAEARGVRERLRRPDERWEHDFAAYRAEHDADLEGRPAEVLGYFKSMPALSRFYLAERVVAIASALAWLVVFVLLGITELRCLVWLGDGEPAGDSGLATFSLVVMGLSMLALVLAPTLYLLVPLLLTLYLVPRGLKEAVAPKLVNKRGRSFLKLAFSELEDAIDRAADKIEAQDKIEAHDSQAAEAAPAAEPMPTAEPMPAGDPVPAGDPMPAGDPPGGNGQSGETGPVR